MAPAAGPSGIPKPIAMPMNATPKVPIVPQEVPVAREVSEHTKQAVNRKY